MHLLKIKHIWLAYLLLPCALVLGVAQGSQSLAWLWNTELGQLAFWHIRLPRVLLAMLVGMMLAMAGVLIQGMVRNPLADPGIIGVSAGAAVGVSCVLWLMGLGWALPSWAQPMAAILGAWVALLLVLKIGQQSRGLGLSFLILAGIAVSVLAGALVSLFSYLASDDALRQISFWSMGSLSGASWGWLGLLFSALLLALWVWTRKCSGLDALLLGEVEAQSVGVNVRSLQWQVVAWTALLTGLVVACCGTIGFIGLVCPHLARLLTGASHQRVLPLAMLLGALLLVIADSVARTVIAPAELPIGIITALIGGPVFITLLVRERRSWR